MTDTLRAQLQSSLGSAYTMERELGGGGMSRVFLAEETRFHRRVVIKVLPRELAAGLSVERFEREIALAAGLQQAHIVPVITAGDLDGLPWYTMPYVEGESLRAQLVYALAATGRRRSADSLLAVVTRDADAGHVSAYEAAVAHAGIGDREGGLRWLARSVAAHAAEPAVWFMICDPLLDPLRADPRFATLVRRMG
jgi:hypothetical protein